MATTRRERDSMGEMDVPAEAYYGAQTARAARNFQISTLRFSREFIRALGLIKKAAAQVNMDLGLLSPELAAAIIRAAQAVAEGKHDDQFVLDVFQTGSGTSTNMNANEVIAGIANEQFTGVRGGRSPVHPNDAVNMGQSSNDVIPTAIHLAALERLQNQLNPALVNLHDRLAERARALDRVVKIGRTHLQDAVPIRLGQEFSGYAAPGRARDPPAGAVLPSRCWSCRSAARRWARESTRTAEFPERMAAALGRETGLPVRPASNTFECMAQRDAAVEASGALKTVAVSLSCIANNIRLLGSGPRCGIGEIRIPELQPGSSIMPGKVNPVIPEAVMMVAAQVVGNDATITWANALGSTLRPQRDDAGHRLQPAPVDRPAERRGRPSGRQVHRRQPLPCRTRRPRGWSASRPTTERCRQLIEKSLAMCTALAPRIGYDIASAIAKAAYQENRTVREIAQRAGGLDPDQRGSPAWASPARRPRSGKRGGSPRSKKWNGSSTRTARRFVEPVCKGVPADDRGE